MDALPVATKGFSAVVCKSEVSNQSAARARANHVKDRLLIVDTVKTGGQRRESRKESTGEQCWVLAARYGLPLASDPRLPPSLTVVLNRMVEREAISSRLWITPFFRARRSLGTCGDILCDSIRGNTPASSGRAGLASLPSLVKQQLARCILVSERATRRSGRDRLHDIHANHVLPGSASFPLQRLERFRIMRPGIQRDRRAPPPETDYPQRTAEDPAL